MQRDYVVQYMRSTLRYPYARQGHIVRAIDTQVMVTHILEMKRLRFNPMSIQLAFNGGSIEDCKKYLTGFWHSLINEYQIRTVTTTAGKIVDYI